MLIYVPNNIGHPCVYLFRGLWSGWTAAAAQVHQGNNRHQDSDDQAKSKGYNNPKKIKGNVEAIL